MGKLFRNYLNSFRLAEESEAEEFRSLTDDLLARPEVQQLEEIVHHHSVSRLQHAKSVAYLTYLHCKKKGLLAEEATRAALLHDLFYSHRRQKEGREKHMLRRHPAIALKNAKRLIPLSQVQEDIIARHMWPFVKFPRTREGRIVTYMDKYCALHEFLRHCFPPLYSKRPKRKELAP